MHPVSVSFQPSTAAPAHKPFPRVRGTGGSSPLNFAKFRRIGRKCGNLAMSCKPDPAPGSKTSGGDDFTVGEKDAVIIVDHGSRGQESNLMLNDFVAMFRARTGYKIVEPAHMRWLSLPLRMLLENVWNKEHPVLLLVHISFLLDDTGSRTSLL